MTANGCSGASGSDDDDAGESGASGESGKGGTGNANGGSSGTAAGKGGSSGTSGGKGGAGGTAGTSGSSGSSGKGGTTTGGSAGAPPDLGEIPVDAEAEWTVFVYGHGDHNLSNSLFADLVEMAKADLGEPGAFNLIVLTDWNASQTLAGSDPPENFPTGVQLFRVPGKSADLEVVAEGAEKNLDDPAVLTSVVGDVFKAFPARHHGVVLWDHGGAWSGGFGSDTQDGTVSMPTAMPAEAIPPAILDGLTAAGVTGKPPLDFVAFDTCLMAGAEIAYPFKSLAAVYLANAEIDYGAGWDYTATFTYLAANPDASPAAFGKAEVARWNAHHEDATTNDALLRSHAALDLSGIDAFADATAELASAISQSTAFDAVELGRGSFLALPPYASQFENAGSSLPGLHDAGQVLDALASSKSDPSVAQAATKARSALDGLLLATSQGSLRTEAGQAGLHIELGAASTLTTQRISEYRTQASAWDGATGWHTVLSTLAAGADSEPPAYTHSVDNADAASASAPPILRFSTPDADAAKSAVYLGRDLDSSHLVLLGLVATSSIEPKQEYEFGWDGTVTTFADDQPAMLDIWLDTGSKNGDIVLMIPGLLGGAAEEPLVTYLVFSSSEGGASVAVVSLGSVASTLSVSELAQAAPEATFAPLYSVIDRTNGETQLVSGDAMPLPASGTFELKSNYASAGGYYFFSALTDVWGNQGVNVDTFALAEPLGP
jgi:cysteine peptidase C11 family protein